MASSSRSGGMGFLGGLTLLFIALKMTGYIDWSWWWVMSPILISSGIALTIGLVLLACVFIKDSPGFSFKIRRRR